MKIFIRVKFTLRIAIVLLATLGRTYAQLKGKVTTPDQKPIENAVVAMLAAADSSLVKTEMTGWDGTFLVANPKPGSYLVSIAMMGFRNFQATGSTSRMPLRKSIWANSPWNRQILSSTR